MKILDNQNKTSLADRIARELLEIVPSIMRSIRGEMRSHRTPDLSVPQFRTLAYLRNHEGASLSEVAEHAGIMPPTMSKMIDALTARGLVERQIHPEDRRRITLNLSEKGKILWREAREATNAMIGQRLAQLTDEELILIGKAMEGLRPLFSTQSRTKHKNSR